MPALYSRLRQPNRVTYAPEILLFKIVQAHDLLVHITERAGFQKTLEGLELWYVLDSLPSDEVLCFHVIYTFHKLRSVSDPSLWSRRTSLFWFSFL